MHATVDAPTRGRELERLSPGLRMLRATEHLESEMKRGGFARYFARFGGGLALRAMQGYRLVGADCHAELVEAALATHLCSGSRPRSFRVLDDAFRDLESPRELKLDYVRDNPSEFERKPAGRG